MDRMASIVIYKALPAVSGEYINIRLPGVHHLQTSINVVFANNYNCGQQQMKQLTNIFYFMFSVQCPVNTSLTLTVRCLHHVPLLFHLSNNIGKRIME